jgi:DNA primase
MTEVEKLLTDKGVRFFPKGKDLLVTCFNPDHDDENPSMRISIETGVYHCFGCGHKGSVFTRYNRYRNIFSSRVNKIKDSISELRTASWAGLTLPTDAFFMYEPYRGIPAEVVQKFGAFKTELLGLEGRVVFPIKDNREVIVGLQGRFINSEITPKYLAYPAGVSFPWYPSPARITPIANSIVLVEGLMDALFLHGKGVTNAVSIFGTKSVSYENLLEKLTPFLLMGIDTVYLLMDGDAAGKSASINIAKMITQQTDIIVEELSVGDGEDPATLSDEYLRNLIKYLTNDGI